MSTTFFYHITPVMENMTKKFLLKNYSIVFLKNGVHIGGSTPPHDNSQKKE